MATNVQSPSKTDQGFNVHFIYGKRPEEIALREEVKMEGTPRVKKFLSQYYNTKRSIDMEFAYWYTREHAANAGDHPMIRRAKALRAAYSNIHPMIRPGEMILMQKSRYIRGASINVATNNRIVDTLEEDFKKIAEEAIEADLTSLSINATGGGNVTESSGHVISVGGSFGLREEEFPITKWISNYWNNQSSIDVCAKYGAYHPDFQRFFELKRSVIGHADLEYGLRHGRNTLGTQYPLQYGFDKMIEMAKNEAEVCMKEGDIEGYIFELAAVMVIEGVQQLIRNYGKEALRLSQIERDPKIAQELRDHAERMEWISSKPARTFRDAIQICHSCHTCVLLETLGSGFSPGRMGQILYPYYSNDIAKGILTRDEALEILEMYRIKYTEIEIITSVATKSALGGSTFNHVCLGGLTPDGQCAENDLEHLFLEAAIACRTTQPTLSIFYDPRLSEQFLLKGIECNKIGSGMPAWVNNRSSIDYCLETFRDEGITMADARSWCLGGCLEIQPGALVNGEINGGSYSSTGTAFLNMPKILEFVIYNGKDPRRDVQVMEPHNLPFNTFDEVYNQFKKYFREIQVLYCEIYNIRSTAAAEIDNPIFYSTLTSDCIKNHRDMDHNGCRYMHTMTTWICGMVNAANSLASIKKNIYDEKNFTWEELIDAMNHNFGYMNAIENEAYAMTNQTLIDPNPQWARIHSLCQSAPKYGNDDPYVDIMFKDLMELWVKICAETKDRFGRGFVCSGLSVSTHGALGQACIADAAGRLAGLTLADGSVSPYPGTDVNGPYAVLNSALSVDHSIFMNTQLNMKVHPSSIKGVGGSRKLLELVKKYIDGGGMHIQFNIVDSRVLEDAQKNPQNYRDLLVRVAGFTQYWVELAKPIQDEIIARTEYQEV